MNVIKTILTTACICLLLYACKNPDKQQPAPHTTPVIQESNSIAENRSDVVETKPVTYTHYDNDTLYIRDKYGNVVKNIRLGRLVTDSSYVPEEIWWNKIRQSEDQDYLFVTLYITNPDAPDFTGLINKLTNQWVVCRHSKDPTPYSPRKFSEVEFMGSSSDQRYFLIKGVVVNLYHYLIYDIHGKIAGSYAGLSDCSENWDEGDRLFYYAPEENYPDTLPPLQDEDGFYVRKYYWKDGKDSATNEYIETIIR